MAGAAGRAGIAYRRLTAVGIGDMRPHPPSRPLLRSSIPQANAEKISIRWNSILETAVKMLGGTEPMCTHERADGLSQARICFSIPLDSNRSVFEYVDVTGAKYLEDWQVESMAAVLALGKLESSPFNIRILDISQLRCEQMEKNCYQQLLKAGEVMRGAKLLLSDWEDTMAKTETCYKCMYEEALDSVSCGANDISSEILCDAADPIYELNRASYLKYSKLVAESEEIKAVEWDLRSRIARRSYGRHYNLPENRQKDFPPEIKLDMKAVLDEVITSLDWDEPTFKLTTSQINLHVCEAVLLSKRDPADGARKNVVIAIGKGSSETEALQNACQRALLSLDTEKSIRLVDVNYCQRAHVEVYVSEANRVAELAVSIGANVVAEWESLIDGLQACKEHCWGMVAGHPGKEPWNQVYNAKRECANNLTDLHEACVSDLAIAKDRHDLLSSWFV